MATDYSNGYGSLPTEELIQHVRSGRLSGPGGSLRQILAARAFKVQSAAEIVDGAVMTGKGMTAEEKRSVDSLFEEARALDPVIKEVYENIRRELKAPTAAYAS
ncbi:MAG TPA: hypothetical protein VN622_05760 [Clostridia bacterium]|nr:hypothetical protein [Clostridia bacterium]HWR35360.1 hypothetical protein [Clostridia bacterium]